MVAKNTILFVKKNYHIPVEKTEKNLDEFIQESGEDVKNVLKPNNSWRVSNIIDPITNRLIDFLFPLQLGGRPAYPDDEDSHLPLGEKTCFPNNEDAERTDLQLKQSVWQKITKLFKSNKNK